MTDAELMGVLTEDAFGNDATFRGCSRAPGSGRPGLEELRLHPVDLGRDEPLTRRGVPRTPSPEVAETILEQVREMSEPLGAAVKLDDGTGLVSQA